MCYCCCIVENTRRSRSAVLVVAFAFLFRCRRVFCGSSGFRRYSFESRTANECVGVGRVVTGCGPSRRVAAAASSLLRTHSSSSLPLPLLLRSCASAVKLIQSRIRHKQKHQQQCVVRCVVAVALLRLPLPLLPSLLIDTKKMKFKRGGSDAHVSFRFVLSA